MPLLVGVSHITAIIADRMDDLPPFTVEGEVSNARPPNASGHLYFTLGDEKAKLNAAFFAYRQRQQGDVPKFQNGDKVRATGRIAVYPPHGSYHLAVEHLELCSGIGELKQKFEALKKKLEDEGLCDPSRKRRLPILPKRIGIVTAATGAAIRDILSILDRRFPNLHILVASCRVQGEGAAQEIADGIRLLNRHFGPDSDQPMDAMIVGRGGGSMEDLWCFSEEPVARAIAASRIPVISAVGHEPDISISDFVADLRAPTPSAAAELLCGQKETLENELTEKKDRLLKALRAGYRESRDTIRRIESSALFREPLRQLEDASMRTDGYDDRMRLSMQSVLREAQENIRRYEGSALFRDPLLTLQTHAQTVMHLGERLETALVHRIQSAEEALRRYRTSALFRPPDSRLAEEVRNVADRQNRLLRALGDAATEAQKQIETCRLAMERCGTERFTPVRQQIADLAARLDFATERYRERLSSAIAFQEAQLNAYNPYAVLKRGYALATKADGALITSAAKVRKGEKISLRLNVGSLGAEVVSVHRKART